MLSMRRTKKVHITRSSIQSFLKHKKNTMTHIIIVVSVVSAAVGMSLVRIVAFEQMHVSGNPSETTIENYFVVGTTSVNDSLRGAFLFTTILVLCIHQYNLEEKNSQVETYHPLI